MHELEQLYRITYDCWDKYYLVHHPKGPVHFKMDHQGLPFTNLGKLSKKVVILLVQTVRGKFVEGCTQREVIKAKETQRLHGMLAGVCNKDYKGLVSSNTLKKIPSPHKQFLTQTIFSAGIWWQSGARQPEYAQTPWLKTT